LRIEKEWITDYIKMHMTSFVMMPCNIICAKIVIDYNRCTYHTNSSYILILASYIEVKYHKKIMSKLAIIQEISGSNEGPTSGVCWIMGES